MDKAYHRQPRVYLDHFIRILLRNAGAPTLWSGKEPPKVIISRSLFTALLRCSVHIIPIGITSFLVWLNLTGYFLGDQLAGGAANQDRDQLLLQIAAKITEIAMVASLSTVVMHVIRAEALSRQGIPLGLLSSPFRFNSINYFWSTAFLSSVTTRPKHSLRRVSVILLIFGCGVLAVVVGPSIALLMIPNTENAWAAGGTDFWLVGTHKALWPDAINASHAGGDFCLHPREANITAAPMFQSSCPWNGYTQLAEGLKDRHFDWQSNMTFNDGVVKRQFTRHQAGADLKEGETWALGPHVATASLLRIISDEWVLATQNASSAQRPGSNRNLKNATTGLGEARVSSWLPTSRVRCWSATFKNVSSTGSFKQKLDFPVLPEFGNSPEGPSYLPGNFWSVSATVGRRYNRKPIATHWIDVPAPNASNHLSAAILVETSYNEHGGRRDLQVTPCSIDTRWAMGTNIGSGLPESDNMVIYGSLKLPQTNISWAPVPGPDWRFASVDRAWLETLLPLMNGTLEQGWTTVAAMFAYAGFDNSTGIVGGSFATLSHTIESTLATIMVDGMSRIGLGNNNGNLHHVIPDRYWLRTLPQKWTDPGSYFDKILAGQTVVLPPLAANASGITRLRWDVHVSGLAYSANSTAAYLALTVLLTCSAIAICHSAYVLATRRSSEAWDCIEELVLLSQLSRPSSSATLVNTSGGIHRRAAYRADAHIVAREPDGKVGYDEEEIQLLLDLDDQEREQFKPIREGKSYGK